jgi:hypothetical protein
LKSLNDYMDKRFPKINVNNDVTAENKKYL